MDQDMEQMVTEVTTNFKRGTTEMLILSLLRKQDRYAYQLSKELKKESGGLFDIQGPSLYTALYRLEKRGFVSTWTEQVGRRPRIYYHILPEGEEFLRLIVAEYHSVQQGIANVLDYAAQVRPESSEKGCGENE